eukprot:m.179325 g.179325  ORF g.179325 m.179325 type:complete len:241 (-) comp18389_c0_seq15:792-1514(-)
MWMGSRNMASMHHFKKRRGRPMLPRYEGESRAESCVIAVTTTLGLMVVVGMLYLFYHSLSSHTMDDHSEDMHLNHDITSSNAISEKIIKRVDNVNERLVLLEANITAHLKKAKAYFAARDEILSNAMAKKSSTWPNGTKKTRFRSDGRCGPDYGAPDTPLFGECDPLGDADQKGPCCRPDSGWCGNERAHAWGHCLCSDCVDFKALATDRTEILTALATMLDASRHFAQEMSKYNSLSSL